MPSQDTMMTDETSSSFSESIQYPSSSSSIKSTITKTNSNRRKSTLTINGYHFQLKNFNRKKNH